MKAPKEFDLNSQLLFRCEAESHDFVAAADASHQQAGEHNAHYLEGKRSHTLISAFLIVQIFLETLQAPHLVIYECFINGSHTLVVSRFKCQFKTSKFADCVINVMRFPFGIRFKSEISPNSDLLRFDLTPDPLLVWLVNSPTVT